MTGSSSSTNNKLDHYDIILVGKTKQKGSIKMTKITPILVRFREHKEAIQVRRFLQTNHVEAHLL